MDQFPTVHTNVWDVLWGIPLVIIATQILKKVLPIPRVFIPTIATVLGLALSIFHAHKHSFWAAVFMGFLYGNAAVGTYAALKTSLQAFRNPETNKTQSIFFRKRMRGTAE